MLSVKCNPSHLIPRSSKCSVRQPDNDHYYTFNLGRKYPGERRESESVNSQAVDNDQQVFCYLRLHLSS